MLSQVEDAAALVTVDGGFGAREFTYLVRKVCDQADLYLELIRAFRVLDPDRNGQVTLEELAQARSRAAATTHRTSLLYPPPAYTAVLGLAFHGRGAALVVCRLCAKRITETTI